MSLTGKTVFELAAHVGGQVRGDGGVSILRAAGLDSAVEGEIAYVEEEKLFIAASTTKASCVITPIGADVKLP